MPDSFVADSFIPDTPTKAPEPAKPKTDKERAAEYRAPRTALDVILNPQGVPEHLLSLVGTTALTGGGGALAKQAATKLGLPELGVKAAPALGRIATSGGLGAAEALTRGESASGAGRGAVMDAVVAGATEGLMAYAGKPTKAAAKAIGDNETAKKAFSWAMEQPAKALQAIAPRVGQFEMLTVPSLSSKPLHLSEIADLLKTKRGVDYAEARKEIVQELNRISGSGMAKNLAPAGESFAARTSETLFDPAKMPTSPRDLLTGNTARSVADALTTQPVYGYPAGAIIGAGAFPQLGDLARRAIGTLAR